MNSLEHILTLKQNLHSLEDTRSFAFMSYLNQVWCKGEKKEYKDLFSFIKDGINYYYDLFEYLDKNFKNMLYPISRGFGRTDHQIICAFDKYINARVHKLNVVNYACDNIYHSFPKSDLIKLPPNISEIKIEIPDAYMRGFSKNLELNISNNRITFNFLNLELSSFAVNNKLSKFDNIINYCLIKTTVIGKPYSICFLTDTYPTVGNYEYNSIDNNLVFDKLNISYSLDNLRVS